MDYLKKLIIDCELHSPEGLKECFENGINPNQLYKDKPLFEELTSEYTRSSRFKDCVQVFMDYGLEYENKALLCVLSNDHLRLEKLIGENPDLVNERHTLKCAY